jgi:alanine racemase
MQEPILSSQVDLETLAGRPVSVDIDLSAVTRNARAVKALIGPGCELMAVVKADGYGLGAEWIARAAVEGGGTRLAVACVDEGIVLRRAGLTCPILVMSYGSTSEAPAAVEHGLTLAIHRRETAAALEAAAAKARLPLRGVPIHIKVDTGLHRFGCLPSEFVPLAEFVRAARHLRLEGLMTHFATADSQDLSFAHEQLARFAEVREEAAVHGLKFEVVHAANSAATLALPEARFDLVRVGIMLSGHYPSPHLVPLLPLEPAITLRSKLIRVVQVEAGESAGYGRMWIAHGPSTIGLVPVGYADGYPRLLSNRGEVLVRGRRCPVVGRISMDQITVDLTQAHGVREGDEVMLIGRQRDSEITADEIAAHAATISYELFTGLAARVPRRYYQDGKVVAVCNLLGGQAS